MSNPATVSRSAEMVDQAPPWQASLQLGFGLRAGHCRLLHNRHSGPLRLQRLLHPQCPGAAEALLLHPPGGIAGGDVLSMHVDVDGGARVLITTPGAAKWYRTSSRTARQSVVLRIAAGACLEWLPQESILFDGSDAQQVLDIDLSGDARMIGWDVVQLGRTAAGENWRSGRWRQDLRLRRDGRLLWCERADLTAESALRQAAQGLSATAVFGTLWASAPAMNDLVSVDALRHLLRDACDRHGGTSKVHAAATLLPHPRNLLLVRALAQDAERLRAVLESAWGQLRPGIIGLDAQRPRIWNT
jgi:urease accessory protein